MRAGVLVVGAGLAGCTIGLLLRQASRDVLVVELKDVHRKRKLCAGAMHNNSIKMFDGIYGAGALESLSPYACATVANRCFEAERRESCFFQTMPRERIDGYCLSRYERAGGRLVDCARLVDIDVEKHTALFENLREGGMFEVRYGLLVGADGACSSVRRILVGRRQRVCPAVQGDVARKGGDPVFEFHPAHEGYCWYLPHDEGATVGCMLHGAAGKACRDFLTEFCMSLGLEMPFLRGAPIPEGDDVLLRASDDAWLIGDAAGLIDAFNGGGIAYALESARSLATALTEGTCYERAMADTLLRIERSSSLLTWAYTKTCMLIALSAGGGARA